MISLFSSCNSKKYNYYDSTKQINYSSTDAIFLSGATENDPLKYSADVERYISVKPSERQIAHSKLGYYNFIHFGMNTFTGKEWGDGTTDPKKFNPTNLDTDQWCDVLSKSGSKGIILTAKHHDGFCLWPSEYTDYDVSNASNTTDIVGALSKSCAKYGLKFGIYLSPWDRHESTYGTNAYNTFFKNQLTELLTNYGELFSVWFDGACGEDLDPDFKYDWEGYYELIRKLQPNAVICVSGPDVRWVGNEAGVARESEWSVVGSGATNPDKVAQISQTDEKTGKALKNIKYNSEDLGSRSVLQAYDELTWAPAEVDVSIHDGWFYHKYQKPKSLQQLLNIYYKSVGGNSSLLLNVPPNKEGRIADKDVERLLEFGQAIKDRFSNEIAYNITVGDSVNQYSYTELDSLKGDNGSYQSKNNDYIYDLTFSEPKKVHTIVLSEDISFSQRVESFSVYLNLSDGSYTLVSNSTIIGSKKIICLNPDKLINSVGIRIKINQSRNNPVLSSIKVYGNN